MHTFPSYCNPINFLLRFNLCVRKSFSTVHIRSMHFTCISNSVDSIAIFLVERRENAYVETTKPTQQYKHCMSAVKYAKLEDDREVALMLVSIYGTDLEHLANTPRIITIYSDLGQRVFLVTEPEMLVN